jgi:hypothetical protein
VEERDDLESAAPLDELNAREIGVPLFDEGEELSSTGYEEAGCEAGERDKKGKSGFSFPFSFSLMSGE